MEMTHLIMHTEYGRNLKKISKNKNREKTALMFLNRLH